jgi:hypothetical protein
MSEPASRPRDALTLHYGIVLEEDAARRLDQGVTRAAARLAPLLLQSVTPPGFAAAKDATAKDKATRND